jgi:hypothetical protein
VKIDPKLGGQWKEKDKFPMLGGQWKEKEKFPMLGSQWKENEKFPMFEGQWKENEKFPMPEANGRRSQWKPFSISPPSNLLRPLSFSFDLTILLYHSSRPLFTHSLFLSLAYKL